MEIDAMKTGKPRGKLSPEEQQRQQDQNRCLYCGGANHKANNCLNMTEAAKK